MSSREDILRKIREGLSTDEARRAAYAAERPETPEVWPRLNPDAGAMAERFISELEAVQGEVLRVRTVEEAKRQLESLLDQSGYATLGAIDSPIIRELTAALPAERLAWVGPDWTPERIATLPVGVIPAELLLADTGSCMVAAKTANERLMCYLPPACIVIGTAKQLAEHMPAAWSDVAAKAADKELRGEFVFITGPSRTADIEKILILGVHGPKRLVVILVA